MKNQESDDFPKTPETKINYIPLPGYWNGFSVDGHNIPHLGYASYHLKIQTDGKSRMYAVRMTDLLSAYTLFADGEIIGKNGNVGKSEKEEIPEWKPSVHSFYSDKRTIHLVLQVSNFHHRLGGIWESIQFGTNTNLLSVRAKNIAIELFLFGSLLIIGLYHLQTFLLRRKEIDLFYFGLYSASFAFRSLVIGERFILEIFPSLNWNCIVRMDYLFPYVLLPLNAAYVFYLFPGYFSRRVLIMEVVVTSITALFVLVTMPLYFSHIAPYFSLFMLLCIFYHMFVYIHVAFKKREGYELLIGGIVVFFATVHDIFRYNFAFDSVNLAEYGVFIFILLQAYYLSKRYATSINKLEEMKEKEKFTFIGQIASEIVHDINNHCQLLFEYSRTKDRETRPALKARLGQIKK
ncbi:MAG: 7TM-DISM domain-containing protein, partial [Leptospira sp.]|nr:7TM-DISM domain-containing protein [Leptospira sp.]